jgi:cell wall-associated NlpC family hydrolase
MHPDRTGPERPPCRRRATSRLLTAALAAAISAGALAPLVSAPPAVAGVTASIDRHSPTVDQQASEAMGRYRRYVRSRTPTNLRNYNRARNEAARATALALGLGPRALVGTWRAAGRRHQVAVLAALTQLDAEYRRYGARPRVGFDCSGLTYWAWRRAGVTIPRSSGDQIAAAARRRRATALPGDLVHYPGHVALYLGRAGAIVHAANPQDDVELSFISRRVRWGDPTR